MSSLDFANALFTKYQQSTMSCGLLSADTSTSHCPSSSPFPAVSSSCAFVSRGYRHHYASSERGSSRVQFPSSSSPLSFGSSLSGLNGGIRGVEATEICSAGGYNSLGVRPLRCPAELFPLNRTQLCSLAPKLPEPTSRRQSSPDQRRLNHERLRIYHWMKSSGEERWG